ncbi:MAG: TlpA disulfide reductase family protein, partial [Psychroflexus sp.]
YLSDFIASTSKSKKNRDLILNKMDSLIKVYPNHDYLGKTLSEMSMKQDLLYNDIRSLVFKLDVDKLSSQDVDILEKYQNKRRKYQIGSQIPSFDLISITGDTVDLKSDFSKYNLIQFWNSWCEKCKDQQEELLQVYQNYNFKGFEIISVSLDTNREDWLTAVSQKSVPWTSLRVKNGFTGELPTEMGITDLPQYYLVDKNGRIIEINLSINELNTILSALMN